jgi:trimethylamine:corrinoid methyltransferase-like protein
LKHLRTTQWRPNLLCRHGHEQWSAEGRTSLLDRAHKRLNRILESHTPTPIDARLAGAIDAVVTDYR